MIHEHVNPVVIVVLAVLIALLLASVSGKDENE